LSASKWKGVINVLNFAVKILVPGVGWVTGPASYALKQGVKAMKNRSQWEQIP